MAFINKLNWKHYESYFKDMGVKDAKMANEAVKKEENKELLKELIRLERNRIYDFKNSCVRSQKELFDSASLVMTIVNDWEKEFIETVLDSKVFSPKQQAIILKLINSVNVSMWYAKVNREEYWRKASELGEYRTEENIFTKSYDKEKIEEEQFSDTTEMITKFEMIRTDFSSIMETELFPHQKLAVNFYLTRKTNGFFNLSSTGVGKSITSIALAEHMLENKEINHIYIVCPLAVCKVFEHEILTHSKNKDLSNYTIINYEKLLTKTLKNTENSLVIVDECHRINNPNSKRFKAFHKYKFKKILLMSATIIGNRLDELKGAFRLIKEKAPIKRGTQQIDLTSLREFAIRVPKSELDLKPMTIRNIPIELNNESEYNLLKSEILSEIKENRENALKEGKTPQNPLVLLLRLLQYTSNKNIIMQNKLPTEEQNKFLVLKELLEDIDGQVIIWSSFVENIEAIANFVGDYFDCGVVHGGIKNEVRNKILEDFKANKFKVLVANPKSLGTGLTLVNATHSIYMDRNFSAIDYLQSMARIYRIGQKNHTYVYNLYYENTIEKRVLDVLGKKSDMIDDILSSGLQTTDIGFKDLGLE